MRSNNGWGFDSAATIFDSSESPESHEIEVVGYFVEGAPSTLLADDIYFQIQGCPLRWVDRKSWWQPSDRQAGPWSSIDQVAWRFEAVAADGQILRGDLRVGKQ
jgi:hypothetical protein